MAKIQIKSEKLTPFGGIFSIMEQFDSTLSSVIDSTLGLRCSYIRCQKLRLFTACHFAHNAESAVFIVTHAVFVSRDCLSDRKSVV